MFYFSNNKRKKLILNKYENIIAFDYGTKKIGSAIGQWITCTARPLVSFNSKNEIPNWKKIEYLLNEWDTKTVVVGFPLNMDGSKNFITNKVESFSKKLVKKFNLKIYFHDERVSTIEAKSILFNQRKNKNILKHEINSISAAVILEGWFQKFSNV